VQKGDYLLAKVLSTGGSLVHESTAQLVGQALKIILDTFFFFSPVSPFFDSQGLLQWWVTGSRGSKERQRMHEA